MTVADYGQLAATETRFGSAQISKRTARLLAGLAGSLGASLRAVRDAPELENRFPVVIYAPSFSAVSWENADLCEYLSSHGYVVLASPCLGARARDMTMDITGINTQASDISFLIGFAQRLANTDIQRTAIVGFSWGGLSNVFAAARDPRIGALVSLDGSLRFSPGFLAQAPDVLPKQMAVPLLSIAQGQWTREEQEAASSVEHRGPNVLNAWTHADVVAIYMLGMAHGEFASMYQRNDDVWYRVFAPWHQSKGGYTREEVILSYGWVARYTLEFLKAYLEQDSESVAFLRRSPEQNGVPPHMMSAKCRTATGAPATFDTFRMEVGRLGFSNVSATYRRFRSGDPSFELAEQAIAAWSEELLDDDHVADAISLLTLCVQIHPDSSRAFASLARAYQESGNRQQAIESYERALHLDPSDFELVDALQQLQSR